MSLLLVDAGNARMKWALHEDGEIRRVQTTAYSGDPDTAVAALRAAAPASLEAIAISNVAGPKLAAELNRAFADRPDCALWYAQSTRAAAGVRNGYVQPEQLGVDRWAAMIGAYDRQRLQGRSAPVCIVDAGTALTIDALERDGTHIGGLIMPGIALQRSCLIGSTAEIAPRAHAGVGEAAGLGIFAKDTATALAGSGAYALAAAIDRCVDELSASLGAPLVILTGGDAEALAPRLATRFEICPNLVLEGLAILFEQRNPG